MKLCEIQRFAGSQFLPSFSVFSSATAATAGAGLGAIAGEADGVVPTMGTTGGCLMEEGALVHGMGVEVAETAPKDGNLGLCVTNGNRIGLQTSPIYIYVCINDISFDIIYSL